MSSGILISRSVHNDRKLKRPFIEIQTTNQINDFLWINEVVNELMSQINYVSNCRKWLSYYDLKILVWFLYYAINSHKMNNKSN